MDPRLNYLEEILADLYPTVDESLRVTTKAGIPRRSLKVDARPLVNWFNILDEATRRKKVDDVLNAALSDYPDHDLLQGLKRDEPAPVPEAPKIDTPQAPWTPDGSDEHFERIMGAQSTLLPISFLEIGLKYARAVGRIVRTDHASGTGFLITSELLLTNHHVFPTAASTKGAVVEFNYQRTADGLDANIDRRTIVNGAYASSKADDWAVVRVDGSPGGKWGTIPLDRTGAKVDDYVTIVQHPGGGPKQIGLFHNAVVFVGQGRIQYLTDTLPGSSGSPVFDTSWKVVAIHHSGGMIREPGTKKSYYRNEGISIDRVLDGLVHQGVQI